MICQWRVSKAEPSGLQVWFDPNTEQLKLYELEPDQKGRVDEVREGDATEDQRGLFPSNNGHESDLPF